MCAAAPKVSVSAVIHENQCAQSEWTQAAVAALGFVYIVTPAANHDQSVSMLLPALTVLFVLMLLPVLTPLSASMLLPALTVLSVSAEFCTPDTIQSVTKLAAAAGPSVTAVTSAAPYKAQSELAV